MAKVNGTQVDEVVIKNALNNTLGTLSLSDSIVIDDTLTQQGQAADSKTVGDTFAESGFYDEVTFEKGRVNGTDYYLATVPYRDSDNNPIHLYLAYDENRNPLQAAGVNHTTLSVNGYCSILRDGSYYNAIAICDGTVVNRRSFEGYTPDNCLYLGITDDRVIHEYKMNTSITPETMLSDGCRNVWNCYFKLINNGTVVNYVGIHWNNTTVTEDLRGPMMIMGIKSNKDVVFLTCDGRTDINQGLNFAEASTILLGKNVVNAYDLDGGGSAAMIARGSKLNRNIDDDGTFIRNIHYTINVKKETKNSGMQDAYQKIGEEKQRIIEQIIPYINYVDSKHPFKMGTSMNSNENLNDYATAGKYYCHSAAIAATLSNAPVTDRGFTLYVTQHGGYEDQFIQIAITNSPYTIYYRLIRTSTSTFTSWIELKTKISPISINSNDNLNNYSTEGKYYCQSGSIAATLSNAPVANRGFTLYVTQHGGYSDQLMQVVVTNNPYEFYYRIIRTSTSYYSTWGKIGPSESIDFKPFYEEITSWKERIDDTTCYFVQIPVQDSNGNIITPYLKYSADRTPSEIARDENTSFTCEGTTGCLQNGSIVRGHVISRGTSVYNNTLTSVADNFKYVSINQDRSVQDFSVNNTSQATMKNAGGYNVFCAYYRLIYNGSAVDNSQTTNNEGANVSTTLMPSASIGVMSDNTLLFMASDGRTKVDKGLTSVQVSSILLDKGCVKAWAIDGGGSTSFNVNGSKFNRNIDDYGMTDRLVHITLNFAKENAASNEFADVYDKIGEEKQNTVQQFMPYINDLYSQSGMYYYEGVTQIPSGANLNNAAYTAPGRYTAQSNNIAASLTNSPTTVSFVLTAEYITTNIIFYTIKDYNGDMYCRRNYIYSNADHFSTWKKVTLA